MPQPLTLAEALDLARELLQSGRLADAAQICSKILDAAPNTAPALHLLALVACRQGQRSAPPSNFSAARLPPIPVPPEVHNDLANVYQMTGGLDEAVSCYRAALQLRPAYAEAHRNLGKRPTGDLGQAQMKR